MRKAGGLLAFFSGLYGILAAVITLVALGGIGSTASVDPIGAWIGWADVALSFLISVLGLICMLTISQKPAILLLLSALTGFFMSETLVSVCMVGALLSGLLAAHASLPSFFKRSLLILRLARGRRQEKVDTAAVSIADHSTAS